jgi:8-oxo-dGTP diphosphatase
METPFKKKYQYDYPRPAVSADVVVLKRDSTSNKTSILLIERLRDPFANCWALPGGFMEIDETIESTAIRELQEETGLVVESIRQIGVFSAVDRDPRGRVLTVGFLAEVTGNPDVVAADDAKSVHWFDLDDLPSLAFDHDVIIRQAVRQSE